MDAAERLFLAQGMGTTTVEQITSGADVAKGTFYLHFSSKEDIRTALGERFAGRHLASVKLAVARHSDDDWKGKLAAWAEASVAFYLDSIRLHDILFYEGRSPTREGLVDNLVIEYLLELLRSGIDLGAWALEDARFTAVFLFSGLHGVVDDAHAKEKPVNRKRLARRVEQLCLRAVGMPTS